MKRTNNTRSFANFCENYTIVLKVEDDFDFCGVRKVALNEKVAILQPPKLRSAYLSAIHFAHLCFCA